MAKVLGKKIQELLRDFRCFFQTNYLEILPCHIKHFWHHIKKIFTSHHITFWTTKIQKLSRCSDIKLQNWFDFQEPSKAWKKVIFSQELSRNRDYKECLMPDEMLEVKKYNSYSSQVFCSWWRCTEEPCLRKRRLRTCTQWTASDQSPPQSPYHCTTSTSRMRQPSRHPENQINFSGKPTKKLTPNLIQF